MTAITDLQWQQLATALGGNGKIFIGEDSNGDLGVLISVSLVNGQSVTNLSSVGVVKFLVRLREAAHLAQEAVNQNQAVGEKLNAFPQAVSDGTLNNGTVIQTGKIQSAIVVASAAEVVGQVS